MPHKTRLDKDSYHFQAVGKVYGEEISPTSTPFRLCSLWKKRLDARSRRVECCPRRKRNTRSHQIIMVEVERAHGPEFA